MIIDSELNMSEKSSYHDADDDNVDDSIQSFNSEKNAKKCFFL